jgi:integrase/recombinase XerD
VLPKFCLYKWRHTFATQMLRSGVDIKTLQTLLGHKDIATTEKYLKALRLDDLRHKVEASMLAAMLS